MPPPGTGRDAVREQLAAGDEEARRARPTDELVGRDEDRVLVGERIVRRVHLDRDVRRGGREVPERQRAVLVEEAGDAVRVADDAGDVARGAEAADPEGPLRVPLQLGGQVRLVDVPVRVLVDDHDVGDRFTPRQLVAVVLERADEHDRPLVGGDLCAQAVRLVELGREAQPEHATSWLTAAVEPEPVKMTAWSRWRPRPRG